MTDLLSDFALPFTAVDQSCLGHRSTTTRHSQRSDKITADDHPSEERKSMTNCFLTEADVKILRMTSGELANEQGEYLGDDPSSIVRQTREKRQR